MSRERLIAEVTASLHPGPWRDLLQRSLEASDTWLPWLVLYDSGAMLGYVWTIDADNARGICAAGHAWLVETRVVPLHRMLWHEVIRMADDECADLDWNDLLS